MLTTAPTPTTSGRGRPRLADKDAPRHCLAQRRYIERKKLLKRQAAGEILSAEELARAPAVLQGGPQQRPVQRIKKASRHKRVYRQRSAVEKQERRQQHPLMLLLAEAARAQERQAEAEAEVSEAAARLVRLQKLQKQLGERNPAANGPAALMLRAAARVAGDQECSLCCDASVAPRSMRCCGNACCEACLEEWLRRNGQDCDAGYGDGDYDLGVNEACAMRTAATYAEARGRGRPIKKTMNTHRCPWCAWPVQSVRRGLL